MHIESLSGTLLYLVAFLIIFSETGLFFLFFLPGDSLLFALGLLANEGAISLWYTLPLLIIASIIGNYLAYFLGNLARGGIEKGKWFSRIKPAHLIRAQMFYNKHGLLAILFARFIPVIRTFVPFFAGIVSMNRRTFSLWTIAGGIAWITTVVCLGYALGREFNLQNIAFLGTGVIVVAVIATPVCIGLISHFLKIPDQK